MDTEELPPGEGVLPDCVPQGIASGLALPEGFAEVIEYLRSDEGRAWQREEMTAIRAIRVEDYMFADLKIILPLGDDPQTGWDSPWCSTFGYLSRGYMDQVRTWWHITGFSPDIPPEGAPPLRRTS